MSLPFAGTALDRAAHLRKDAAALHALWHHQDSLVLYVDDERQVAATAEGMLDWRHSANAGPYVVASTLFLGLDGSRCARFGVDSGSDVPPGVELVSLREIALNCTSLDQSAAALAVALAGWHSRSRFCTRCGAATHPGDAGHSRTCLGCARDIFPRSDVAVIMLVRDGEYCVLGRRIGSDLNRWSTLAGFVEASESPEAAVAREVREEVGLVVTEVRYRGSQPWPFPSSLMLAYEAHAAFGELTMNEEHHEVRWFHREEIRRHLERGEFAVPSRLSAGGHLIAEWLG